MKLGAITNSWREQLGREDIGALVGEAQARGARHVELRQTCLGDCESGEGEEWRPNIGRMEALVAGYPGLSFNLAVAYPCLTQMAQPESGLFGAMLVAAIAVAPSEPHLRMVDPARFEAHWESAGDIPDAAMSVGELVKAAAARGGYAVHREFGAADSQSGAAGGRSEGGLAGGCGGAAWALPGSDEPAADRCGQRSGGGGGGAAAGYD